MNNDGRDEKDQLRELIEPEKELFYRACDAKQDPVLTLLRVHLLTEYYLERFIQLSLPRADRVVTDGALSYHQKLVLVASCDVIKDEIIQCLKELNRIRNRCAHELEKKISWSEVEVIARPLGKLCTKWRRESKRQVPVFLVSALSYICGYLAGQITVLEEARLQRTEQQDN